MEDKKAYEKIVSEFNKKKETNENSKVIEIIQACIIGAALLFEIVKEIKKMKKLSKKKDAL